MLLGSANPMKLHLESVMSIRHSQLTDTSARGAYDQSRKVKKAADERLRVLDSKRKKFKQGLEAREQAAFEKSKNEFNAADEATEAKRKLHFEIERLRKEGSKLLEQEQDRLKEELKKSTPRDVGETQDDQECPRIKLKWQAKKGDPDNGGYNSRNLNDILNCYGPVSALIISTKCNGSAIAEFGSHTVTVDILDNSKA